MCSRQGRILPFLKKSLSDVLVAQNLSKKDREIPFFYSRKLSRNWCPFSSIEQDLT